MNKDLYERLRIYCIKEGCFYSGIIGVAVKKYLDENPQLGG